MYTPIDQERAMYIYKQRKEGKRTFADIGRELGITGNRVNQIYRRIDWKLNGIDADHHKDDPSFPPPWFDVVKDPDTGKTIIIPKSKDSER